MVGSTEDARISPYLLLFWTILEGWVGFSKVKSFSLKSSQSRDLTILSTCQGSGSRSFHLVCLRILELVFLIDGFPNIFFSIVCGPSRILDIRRGVCEQCPQRIFCHWEKFQMWRTLKYGELLDVEKCYMCRSFI